MIPIRVGGPAVEPVSLADARTHLRLDDTHEDDLVTALIEAGRLLLESATRLIFINQSWRLILEETPRSMHLHLPLAPIIAITEIRVIDAQGVTSVVDPQDYRLRPGAQPPGLMLADSFPRPSGGIEIDLEAGFGPAPENVPAPLRQALRMLVARWFEERGDGAGEPETGLLPPDVALMIAPYRHLRLN
ncbi:head-tail connector protein [Saliniramus sp.]|uniref:head-tail connector protein n=1 Tax=Saliniramus sp. TaxID=2986772 RepID=UPI002CC386EF|nr:hypothetical protein [Saliniramus sp.]HMB10958.1 hypothetical protein [Saliniramus sp.]